MASSSGSSARNVFSGYFGPGPASSSESMECPTPPGFMRVHPLGRWRCFICRQRYARMRDLRGHICSVHSQVNSMYNDRGAFPFFRRCLTCHRQHRIRYYIDLADGMVHLQRRHPGQAEVNEQEIRLASAAVHARNSWIPLIQCKRPRLN